MVKIGFFDLWLVVNDDEKIFEHHYGMYGYVDLIFAYQMGQGQTKKVIRADMSISFIRYDGQKFHGIIDTNGFFWK
jgi:hypothetical protein